MKPIRKAVLPVAGLGTRFLPATKAVPKEMLTVVDRPVVQHVVDEAREAGIEHFIFVTGRGKAVIEDHFDIAFELDHTLQERGQDGRLRRAQEGSAQGRPDQLHPPAGAPRPGPRRLVRPRDRRRRALRGAAAGHAEPRLHAADAGDLRAPRRQHHRRRGGGPGGDASIRHRQRRRDLSASPSRSPAWSRSPSRARRRRTSSFRAATSCSRRSSASSSTARRAPAARSSSPMP